MKVLNVALVLICGCVNSQFVNNVHLMGHTSYMISILQEVVTELEHREWCNLKVPDITLPINDTVIDRHYEGTITLSKGFVASMQWIDIRQSGVDQNWTWNTTDETGTVRLTGTLRMLDLALGYDVDTVLEDGRHRHTVAVTYPLILFTFTIWKNVNTDDVRVGIEGTISTTATIRTLNVLPADNTADVIASMFNFVLPGQGITAWADDVFLL